MTETRYSKKLARSLSHEPRTVKPVGRLKMVTRRQEDSPLCCPRCGARSITTLDSRPADDRSTIQRRRGCASCNHRWITVEIAVEALAALERKAAGGAQTDALGLALGAFVETLRAHGYVIERK